MADSRVLKSTAPVAAAEEEAEEEEDALIMGLKVKHFWDLYGNEVNAA